MLVNKAHNLSEEGIKLEYYNEAFRDYLVACGYYIQDAPKKINQKLSSAITHVAFEDVEQIDTDTYHKLTKNYYKLTEAEKNAMRLYEYNQRFIMDSELWEQTFINNQMFENIPLEYSEEKGDLYEMEAKTSANYFDIYAPKKTDKLHAIKTLNTILGATDTLSVVYTTETLNSNTDKLIKYFDDNSGLLNIAPNKGKVIGNKYINSVISSIYHDWCGLSFVSTKKNKRVDGKVKKITTYQANIKKPSKIPGKTEYMDISSIKNKLKKQLRLKRQLVKRCKNTIENEMVIE
jgi:hypothetical protein